MWNLRFSQWCCWRFQVFCDVVPCRLVNTHKPTRRKYFTQFTLCVQRQNGRTASTLRNSHQETKWKRLSQVGERREKKKKKRSASCRVSWSGSANTQYETWTCDHEWRNTTTAFGKWTASHTHQILLRATHYSQLKRYFSPPHALFISSSI
jgi:hypothetical protein